MARPRLGLPGRTGSSNKNTELGALNTIIQKLIEIKATSGSANAPSHQQLTNPSSVVIGGWKKLDFACSGAITVTLNGNAIIYPFTLGSSTVLGESLESEDTTLNSITFNGTGTVLVTIKK